jgi:alanine racemase
MKMLTEEGTLNSHGQNRHSRISIDLAAIRYNYQKLKTLSGGSQLIAVVKADAYGHGAIEIATALPNADAFAVAAVGEAVSLRESGITQKILIMGGFISVAELQSCIDLRLDPVIHQQFHIDCLRDNPALNQIEIWMKVDSGMGRLGFPANTVNNAIEQLEKIPTLGQMRMMSHFASADEIDNDQTEKQMKNINDLKLDHYEWGVSNSAGIIGWPKSHKTWVRSGIAMYGANPMSNRKQVSQHLRPSMTMTTIVLAVNQNKKGDVIGYAGSYICPKDMTIAVIAAGYADGYPRLKTQSSQINIQGQLCNIVGRVSMDMITVDISGLVGVKVGDEVCLFGASPEAEDIADDSLTIAYEIFCNVGSHAKRVYINIAE